MSGSLDLTIETGEIWNWQLAWKDGDGNGYPFTDPIMNIRQDINPKAPLIARLDQSGTLNGTLIIPEAGVLQVLMTGEQTVKLKSGSGFWDIFVTLYGNRVRLIYGTVNLAPHVTELI